MKMLCFVRCDRKTIIEQCIKCNGWAGPSVSVGNGTLAATDKYLTYISISNTSKEGIKTELSWDINRH